MKIFRIVPALLCALSLFAQSDRGTITGTVTDPSDAAVANAKVAATNVDTGTLFDTETTSTGNFSLASVPAGKYDLSVQASGFSTSVQRGIQVQVALTARIDVKLKIGATADSVTVTAETPLLRTENAEQSMNVSGDRLNALPINVGQSGAIRNPFTFSILAPGVSGNDIGARVGGFSGAFRVMLEGQDITSGNAVARANEIQPSVEAVGEYTLQTSNYSAEYGQALSGIFNFTTRSGTNRFHGSAYEYFVNEALNSYTSFTHIRPVSRKNDWGGSIGGPVSIPKIYNGRNKTFFFFNLEVFRNRQLASNNAQTLPTDAYRTGDFSGALTGVNVTNTLDPLGRQVKQNTIYDPRTTRTVNGSIVRDPFAGNILPQSRLDPVALKVQALIPKAFQPNVLINNWAQTEPNTKFQTIPTTKIDQNFGSAARASFYWSKERTDQISSNDSLPVPITARRNQFIYAHTLRLNYDHTIKPTLLAHFGIGYVRYLNPDSSPRSVLEDYDQVANLGLTGAAAKGFPRINSLSTGSAGGMGLTMGPTNANYYYNDKFTSLASLTYIRKNHTYKFGGELKIDIWTDRNSRGATGVLNFSNAQTGLPWLTNSGLAGLNGSVGLNYASFLLGLVDNGSVNAVQDPQWRKNGWAFYGQDTWKATRKLTIDYGLRWDLQSEGHEIWYRNSQFGPTIPNPSAGNIPGGTVYEGYGPGRCNCTFTKAYPFAFGPRLGLAYQLNSKTVLRAGWGVSYSSLQGYNYLTNAAILGVGFDTQSFTAVPGSGDAAFVLKDGFQTNIPALYKASLDPGVRPSGPGKLDVPGQFADPNGGRPARVNSYTFTLQREVTKDLAVEASFVGNRGVWESAGSLVQMNLLSQQRLAQFGIDLNSASDRALLTKSITSPEAKAKGLVKPYASFPDAGLVNQAIRPFPQFSDSLTPRWAPVGNSWYDSLQIKVTKRFSHGLDGTLAYTWQKELSLTGASNNMFNRESQKGLSGIPQIFVAAFNYQTPEWRNHKLVSALVGGWTLGGIVRYQAGGYIAPPGSQNALSSQIFQGTRQTRVPGQPLFLKSLDCHCIDPYQDLVLNPAAWQDVPAGQFGPAPSAYSDYRGLKSADEQVSLGRTFRIREGMSFQVRAEFFNAFNRINWAGPSSGGNPLATPVRNAAGQLTSGFGFINALSSGNNPRNGQLVARFTF